MTRVLGYWVEAFLPREGAILTSYGETIAGLQPPRDVRLAPTWVGRGDTSEDRFTTPTSPANAGAQIHPERLGMVRHRTGLNGKTPGGSIWVPAFAGKVGFMDGCEWLRPTRCGRQTESLSHGERDSAHPLPAQNKRPRRSLSGAFA